MSKETITLETILERQIPDQVTADSRRDSSMDRIRRSRLIGAGVILGACALLLSGCLEHDYEGNGDEFELQGQVESIGHQSVRINLIKVLLAHGDARHQYVDSAGYAKVGKFIKIHNNYEGSACEENVVGEEFGYDGQAIDLPDIHPGDYVDVIGNVREDKDTCGKYSNWHRRPVYEEVRLITQDQLGHPFQLLHPEDTGFYRD